MVVVILSVLALLVYDAAARSRWRQVLRVLRLRSPCNEAFQVEPRAALKTTNEGHSGLVFVNPFAPSVLLIAKSIAEQVPWN
jgi:hypothetical protein